jgi:hypothetical protein
MPKIYRIGRSGERALFAEKIRRKLSAQASALEYSPELLIRRAHSQLPINFRL